MGKKKLTDTGVGLHSRIRGGMLECRLPIRQPLCWNGQMEGIYTSVSSALIGDGPTSRAPVAIRADQSISRGVVYSWISPPPPLLNLIRFHTMKKKRKGTIEKKFSSLSKGTKIPIKIHRATLGKNFAPIPISSQTPLSASSRLEREEKEKRGRKRREERKMRKIFPRVAEEEERIEGCPCLGRGYPLLIAKAK